ncbi:MAG TPA: CHAP domain-containing protein [Rhizomicrobium sp.]|nr:CHAP domain-containing protein [Rhizomicrobium sp.]
MSNSKSWFLPLAAALLFSASLTAHAGVADDVAGFKDFGARGPIEGTSEVRAGVPVTVAASGSISEAVSLTDFATPSLPTVVVAQLPQPSVETPLHKLFCVEYARMLSGLNIFGDAKYWWERARNLYARIATPAEQEVMVFATSPRLKKGHVAVVTAIVSKREIRVEQANWQNHGEIDHATPVLDVSAKNDWSQVRVWDMRSQSFGGHVYAIAGFIAKRALLQADKD